MIIKRGGVVRETTLEKYNKKFKSLGYEIVEEKKGKTSKKKEVSKEKEGV